MGILILYLSFYFLSEVWFQNVPTKCFLFAGSKLKFLTAFLEGFSGRLDIKFAYMERWVIMKVMIGREVQSNKYLM